MVTVLAGNNSQSQKSTDKSGAFGNQPGAGMMVELGIKDSTRKSIEALAARYFESRAQADKIRNWDKRITRQTDASKQLMSSIKEALKGELGDAFSKMYRVEEYNVKGTPASSINISPSPRFMSRVETQLGKDVTVWVETSMSKATNKEELSQQLEQMFIGIHFVMGYSMPDHNVYRVVYNDEKPFQPEEQSAAMQHVIEFAAKQRGEGCEFIGYDSMSDKGVLVAWAELSFYGEPVKLTITYNQGANEATISSADGSDIWHADPANFRKLLMGAAFSILNNFQPVNQIDNQKEAIA